MSAETIFDKMDAPVAETGNPDDKNAVSFEAVRQRIFGNKRKSPKSGKSKDTPIDETLPGEKELEKIFAGENWEEVSSLYFNARFAVTGWDGFLLTDAQKKTLGLSLATTMKMLLKIDPGYIALIVFTANFGGLIAQKEVIYKKLLKDFEEKQKTSKVAS